MLKKIFSISFLFIILLYTSCVGAKELQLIKGHTYILNFDEEIQNFHTSSKDLSAQIIHTIFNDRKQIVLSLRDNKNAYLQVKTEKKLYNYEIKPSNKYSKEVLEIDFPPIGELDVDIYAGEN